jgi:hypothetical protein
MLLTIAPSNGASWPWTEMSVTQAKIILSSFQVVLSGICHSDKKPTNTLAWATQQDSVSREKRKII